MNFKNRKLPGEAAADLRRCPIRTIEPYALMVAPVYVFMPRNEKFISVKAPMDFFTPEDLRRFKELEQVFMPPFVDEALPYRDLARRARMLLGWMPVESGMPSPPAPYEMSDAMLRLMGPLWGESFEIESFFVCVFVNELCSLLPGDELISAREADCGRFEHAAVISAWMVFLSLHLGTTDLDYLNRLRLATFRKIVGTGILVPGMTDFDSFTDAGQLLRILEPQVIGEKVYQSLGLGFFTERKERIARKIVARIERVRAERLGGNRPLEASVFGENGLIEGGAG